ncbi:MAG: hypothetical protein GXN93_00920 [Candidatus Diapherotrites archaeon]|nr:hypothetical protein [Candidatus Diapherotrites archaeon]
MPRRKSSKTEGKKEVSRETHGVEKAPAQTSSGAKAKHEKAVKKNQSYNPTYVLVGIAILALVIGLVIGLGIGKTHGVTGGASATFSKPVAYVITSPDCEFCNETLNQGLAMLEQQFGFSNKEFNVVKLSYNDPTAKRIYEEIYKNNQGAAYLPVVVLEGNITGTTLYKKIKEFADSRKIPVQNLIQPAGKYYVLAPISITYRYDPNKPIQYFYIYTNNAQQLYRLAGQIMSLQPNMVVKFEPASGNYEMKMVGPKGIVEMLKRYFPTAELEGNALIVPKVQISVEAQKPILDQVKTYLQQQVGMGADINATALPSDSNYFVIVKGPKAVLQNVIPPEWNYSNGEYYVLKTDRPKVDLFVMSYCPFGLQAEKAIIPVIKLLGNNVDFHVRFVNYSMHAPREPELTENTRQYCIQKLDKNAYLNYLSCFTETGNASKCMAGADINAEKINACIQATTKEYNISVNNKIGMFPAYPVEEQMNKDYHVQGSPTLVIQYVPMAGTPRNPEALKELICAAFLHPPKACSTTLSSQNTSPGIGGGTTSASAAGSCS